MIYTRFESYCEKCEELAPEAIINVCECADSCRTVDTTIYCRHRHRCAAIKKQIEKEATE